MSKKHSVFLRYTPGTRREIQGLGRGARDYLVCADCGAVYWKKGWHHSFSGSRVGQEKRIKFVQCPACKTIAQKEFEGEVKIDSSRIPAQMHKELVAHIRHVGEEAFRNDPLDRIIAIRDQRSAIRITTTENHLAIRIGREVEKLLKGRGKEKVKFSKDEDVIRVFWESRK